MAANMNNGDPIDTRIRFFVGHHESDRSTHVTDELLLHAHDLKYDMLTAPITNSHFHSRVLTLLSAYKSLDKGHNSGQHSEFNVPQISPINYLDTHLSPNDLVSQVLYCTSSWIDLSSSDPLISAVSQQVLHMEISYAAFAGAVNIIVQGPRQLQGRGLLQYARAILKALQSNHYVSIHIQIPMYDLCESEVDVDIGNLSLFARNSQSALTAKALGNTDQFTTWDAWNVIRTMCNYHPRLFIALNMPHQLPSQNIQSRWFSEPLRILNFPETSFHRNAKGYPVLSKSQQHLLYRYMRLRPTPWLLLSDVGPLPGFEKPDMNPEQKSKSLYPTPAEALGAKLGTIKGKKTEDPTPHLSYFKHLQAHQPSRPAIERFSSNYQDYLQNPLQPLADNLESITYEVFEKDPVKYSWYERAIAQALNEWSKRGLTGSGPQGRPTVAVVGAGRGPLVTRALSASSSSGVQIDLWALEKNPNAFVLLQQHNVEDWEGRVKLIQSDMRAWKGPHYVAGEDPESFTTTHVDILISELLGSFGDNELSPECLDGIQHILNPKHGISIPASYSAHITPIATPKLHANILSRLPTTSDAAQTPYVVMLNSMDYLSTFSPPLLITPSSPIPEGSATTPETKESKLSTRPVVLKAWEFSHPRRDSHEIQSDNTHNTRFTALTFFCKDRGICHGLAGYFETVLYKAHQIKQRASESSVNGDTSSASDAVELSINPLTIESKSKDMISWFPMFFPLKTPIYFSDHTELDVSMWRQTNGRKVWYEWIVEAFTVLASGMRVRVGSSDLHSSENNACLL